MKIRVNTAIFISVLVSALIMLFLVSSLADAAEQKDVTFPTGQDKSLAPVSMQNSFLNSGARPDLAKKLSNVILEIPAQVYQLAAPPPSEADLSISKSANSDPVSVGQLLEYTITVNNAGPDRAAKVVVTDTLPAEVSFVSASVECILLGEVECNLNNIKVGESKTVIIAVTVNSEGNGAISNTAGVSSNTPESKPGDEQVTISTNVRRTADLSISKSADPDPVTLGQILTYTITVDNNGPSAATNVIVTDTLPSEVSFNSASAGCNNTGVIVCSLGAIPAGGNKSVEILVTVNSEGSGIIANNAVVSSDTPEANPGDESTTITTSIQETTDLSISKLANPDPVSVGGVLTYEITVDNKGPSVATNVVVVDNLAAGLTFQSASLGCNNPGDVECSLGSIPVDGSKTITIAVNVDSAVTGAIENTAFVTSDTIEANPGDESTTISTNVSPYADLAISKSDSPDPASGGQVLTYTITVDNLGPFAATDVVVTDILPTQVSFNSASAGCTYNVNVVCSLGSIENGANKSVDIVVLIGSDVEGVFTNQADVSSATTDPNLANNHVEEGTSVNAAADLSITKVDSHDPAAGGTVLTYTITVENHGPFEATEATIIDVLPNEVSFVSASAGCTYTVNVTCTLDTLSNGASESVDITVLIGSEVSGTITNQAAVASITPDSQPANNSVQESTQVSPAGDLMITSSDSHDPAVAGEVLTYTIAVENLGPFAATDVVINDVLPVEVSFISASAGCTHPGNVICDLGNLVNGASETVNIVVSIAPGVSGIITNQADVSSTSADSNLANNHVKEVTNINGSADLAITKSDSPDPAIAGEVLTYTVRVENLGPDDAVGVTITDTLPAEVSLLSATAGCILQDVLTCPIGSLAAGESKDVTIVVTVDSSAPVVITNRAELVSAVGDDNPNNNQVTEETAINNQADLSIVNYVSSGPIVAGQQLTYTLVVTNVGPSMAREVTINSAILPAFNFVSSPDCNLSGDSINCDLGELDAGETKETIIVVSINPEATGIITAVSTVFSSAQDLFPSNNSSIAVDNIWSISDLIITKTGSSTTVIPGKSFTYTVNVVNVGPSVASQVNVSDVLPAGLSLVEATVSQGAGCDSANPVSCNLGDLLVNQVATVSLVVDVAPSVVESVENSASVLSLAIDPNTTNNQDTLQTPVGVSANLYIEKQDDQDPVTAGTSLEYTLLIGNAGPSDASEVVAIDNLPAGVTFKSVTNNAGGTCEWTSIITCQFDTLSVGAEASIKILVDVDPGQNSALVNTATVDSEVNDPDLDDNTTTEATEVIAMVDLRIEIAGQPNPVVAGETLSYTLQVTNEGPSLASDVVVTTTLPSDVQLSHSQTSQGAGCSGDSLVICQLGPIVPLSDAYVILSTTVYTEHDGLIETSTIVSSGQTDLVPANNNAEKSVIVLDRRFDVYLPIIPNGSPAANQMIHVTRHIGSMLTPPTSSLPKMP